MIRFEEINISNFHRYETRLLGLYLSSFTLAPNPQFMVESEARKTLSEFIGKGFGLAAISGEQCSGLIIVYSLKFDHEFLEVYKERLKSANYLYIAEVMVDERFRGKGIAMEMLNRIERIALEKGYDSMILRVWDENRAALSLYRKSGFEETGIEVFETKYKDETTPFEMRKIYMYKNLKQT